MTTALEEKAAEILTGGEGEAPPPKRVGRPPGSKTKKSHHKKKGPAPSTSLQAPQGPTEADIQAATILGSTIWLLAGKFLHCRPLDDQEARQLGMALEPVLSKYLPSLDEWREETTLAIVVIGLYGATKIKTAKTEPAPLNLEMVGE